MYYPSWNLNNSLSQKDFENHNQRLSYGPFLNVMLTVVIEFN